MMQYVLSSCCRRREGFDLENNIPGAGEFRELRWEDPRRGELRIIFYLVTADH